MKNYHGNLRHWLWTLLPALNLATFYAMAWRGVVIHAGVIGEINTAAHIGAHDALYEGLRTVQGYLLLGTIFSVAVWCWLTFAASPRLSPRALWLHAGVYVGGLATNILLLVTDPGKLLYWWMG